MKRLLAAGRVMSIGKSLRYIRYFDDFGFNVTTNLWTDTVLNP